MTLSPVVVVLLAVLALACAEPTPITLERIHSTHGLTVSGLSSGAYMAVQMHVAHSAAINGSAIFAGGPWYCAESNIEYAQYKCMDQTLGAPETAKLVALTNTDAVMGLIDSPANLANSKVYLFSGKDDTVVDQRVMKSLLSYYMSFIPAPANIKADFNVNAEHCMPTTDYGEDCPTLGSPYIGKCDFDGAGIALQHLYGDLVAPTGKGIDANLFAFDQTPFFVNTGLTSIGKIGYIYIPTACQTKSAASCRLHMSFHGCEQNLELIGNAYAAHSGYNSWAEANNIVVIYPYATVSKLVPYNPKGCWDWWAYTGVDYGVKSGVQIKFAWSLAQTVLGA